MAEMKRAFQWDLARQIEKPEFLMQWLPRYADWGYEQVYLYLENAYDFPSYPGLGRKYAWNPRQMERFVQEATRCGIEVVPIAPLLGHAAYLLQHEALKELSETRGPDGNPLNAGQLCPLHDCIPEVAGKILGDLRPFCTAGIFHASLDESFSLATCPKCRREVEEIGLGRHFANHVNRLDGLCKQQGVRLGMWADMLYYIPEAIELLPKDVIAYDWFYYPFKKTPRVELFNFADVDLTGKLRAAGLDVFGCPNNGPFSSFESLPPVENRLANIGDWWRYCRKNKAQGMLITSWDAGGTSIELNMAIDAAAASLWLNPDVTDFRRMYRLGVERVFGKGKAAVAGAMLKAAKYPHCGNHRWQADRGNWRAMANFLPLEPARREERHFSALREQLKKNDPGVPAVTDLLVFRHYLAMRQLFTQAGARSLASARKCFLRKKEGRIPAILDQVDGEAARVLALAQEATRAFGSLWRRSRHAGDKGRVDEMLTREIQSLKSFRRFLRDTRARPERLLEASLLLGRWQLLFWVRKFAPALQGFAVELQQPDGSWKSTHGQWLIEFSPEAAQPRSKTVHRHSVPVDWDGRAPLRVRLAARGIGEFAVYGLELTDGVVSLVPASVEGAGIVAGANRLIRQEAPGAVIGKKAPTEGFPLGMDFGKNQGWVEFEITDSRSNR